jgi:hypothetical protein
MLACLCKSPFYIHDGNVDHDTRSVRRAGASGTTLLPSQLTGKKASFWSAIFIHTLNILPRQARDKQKENSQNWCFIVGFFESDFAADADTAALWDAASVVIGAKNALLLSLFDTKHDHFAKTGSGQT